MVEFAGMIERSIKNQIVTTLNRGKSVLIFGARQTGKTTLLKTFGADIHISLAKAENRYKYEADLASFSREIVFLQQQLGKKPLVFLDEFQKIPALMDSIQDLIDEEVAQFILTGSSARKIRKHTEINLLPGRVIIFYMDPISLVELPAQNKNIDELLMYGSLPSILCEPEVNIKEQELRSYSHIYLAEEIEAEAAVRKIGKFANFLQLSAAESGCNANFLKMSNELGVSRITIESYYQVLEDCLVAYRLPAYTKSTTRKRLTKSNKYLYFDLGVRRLCAKEGTQPTREHRGHLFEQFVGLELIRHKNLTQGVEEIYYWRDYNGVEVDYILEFNGQLIPIKVKYSNKPHVKMINHLTTFIEEHPQAHKGYVICNCDIPQQISETVSALPWHLLWQVFV